VLSNYKVEYTGLDISEDLVNIAREIYPKEKFIVSDLSKTPFGDAEFDAVISIATLHHLPGTKRKEALAEIHRILKPQGKLMVTVWYFWMTSEFITKIVREGVKILLGLSNLGFGDFYRDWKDSNGKFITNRYFHAWSKREFRRLLKKIGFNNLKLIKPERVVEKRNLIVITQKK